MASAMRKPGLRTASATASSGRESRNWASSMYNRSRRSASLSHWCCWAPGSFTSVLPTTARAPPLRIGDAGELLGEPPQPIVVDVTAGTSRRVGESDSTTDGFVETPRAVIGAALGVRRHGCIERRFDALVHLEPDERQETPRQSSEPGLH